MKFFFGFLPPNISNSNAISNGCQKKFNLFSPFISFIINRFPEIMVQFSLFSTRLIMKTCEVSSLVNHHLWSRNRRTLVSLLHGLSCIQPLGSLIFSCRLLDMSPWTCRASMRMWNLAVLRLILRKKIKCSGLHIENIKIYVFLNSKIRIGPILI